VKSSRELITRIDVTKRKSTKSTVPVFPMTPRPDIATYIPQAATLRTIMKPWYIIRKIIIHKIGEGADNIK